jgi:Family of unknown function (DUF6256)
VPASSPVSQALIPMLAGYLLVMTALGSGLYFLARSKAGDRHAGSRTAERPDGTRPAAGPRHGWLLLARHVAGTAAGGYLLLMAVVIACYYGVARAAGDFITSAFTGTAMLIAIALPLWGAASWLTERRRQRDGDDPGEREGRGP